LDYRSNNEVPVHVQKGLLLPAIFGVKQLPGALPDEGRAARARRFTISTHHHRLNMDVEEFRTGPAVAQPIFRIQVIAASGAHESTRSLWMIDIESVTACPTFVHLDVTVTFIDHIRRTAFAAHHLIPLALWCLITMPYYLEVYPVGYAS
jgi:hypothetical protein